MTHVEYQTHKKRVKSWIRKAPISWAIQVYSEKLLDKIKEEMKEALKKALLEFFRVIVLAAIPVLILQVESGKFDWKGIATVVIIAGLRFIDKFLHELGKENESDRLIKGLTQF